MNVYSYTCQHVLGVYFVKYQHYINWGYYMCITHAIQLYLWRYFLHGNPMHQFDQ